MAQDSRWLVDRIGRVMSLVRGSSSNPYYTDFARSALGSLREDVARYEFPNKARALTAIEQAAAAFESGNAPHAVQHLSRALLSVTRSDPS